VVLYTAALALCVEEPPTLTDVGGEAVAVGVLPPPPPPPEIYSRSILKLALAVLEVS